MNYSPLLSAFLACIFAISNLSATEVVVLKSGERFEGDIVLKDDVQVIMDVRVSATIIDRQVFSMEDVEEVVRPAEDERDFQAIANLRPGENSAPLSTYDRILAELLDPFIAKHPDSVLRPRAEELRQAFSEERERVAGGEVKLDSQWLTAEEVEERRSEIDARVIFNSMRDAASRGDHIGVMNGFERMERDFKGELVYPDAVVLAQNAIRSLQVEVPRLIETNKTERTEWEAAIQLASETRKQALIAARNNEDAAHEAVLTRASSSGLRWPPLISRSLKSLESIRSLVDSSASTIQSIDVGGMRASVDSTREAREAVNNHRFETAGELLEDALARWPENARAAKLKSELPEREKAYEEALVAAAEAEREAAEEQEASEAAEREAALAADEATAAAAAATATQPAVAAQVDNEKPFFMTVPGAVAILVGVLVIVTLSAIVNKARLQKKVSRAEE